MYGKHRFAKGKEGQVLGTGWLPPMPDLRDYTPREPKILEMTNKIKSLSKGLKSPPAKVDLRPWCSPVEDQGLIGSCTAHAAVGVIEYFQKRAFDKYIDGSRLFVYKATRNLMQTTGDSGAWLRATMGALRLCGVPDERYWPYPSSFTCGDQHWDDEPPSFVYAVADNYEALKYFRHDPVDSELTGKQILASVKQYLAAGVPAMFGMYGFASYDAGDSPGAIPYPCKGEEAEWGHAMMVVGYDNRKKITNTKCNQSTIGALLIRNSWGTKWGEFGYGWLPYEYVLQGLADDFWSLLSMDWVDTGQFEV